MITLWVDDKLYQKANSSSIRLKSIINRQRDIWKFEELKLPMTLKLAIDCKATLLLV